jgi:hypothetical protein
VPCRLLEICLGDLRDRGRPGKIAVGCMLRSQVESDSRHWSEHLPFGGNGNDLRHIDRFGRSSASRRTDRGTEGGIGNTEVSILRARLFPLFGGCGLTGISSLFRHFQFSFQDVMIFS